MLVFRQGRMFKINELELPVKARNTEVKNSLYVAIFKEFQGASVSDKYKNFNAQQRMQLLNEFAVNWLTSKGYK